VSARSANDAAGKPRLSSARAAGSAVLRVQILLDRAHFSPGEIDGRYGSNTRMAVAAFNQAHGLRAGQKVDRSTWGELDLDTEQVIVPYTITPEDVAGPFEKIPVETSDKASLVALGYESAIEGLGERFHASPKLIASLNPGGVFDRAGGEIQVPNVERPPLPKSKGVHIRVSEVDRTVEALDADGHVLARYPATVGSEHDPLPVGEWKVSGVKLDPSFVSNPELFWDAEPGDTKEKLAHGPNNPVGVVWIGLSKPHYGIHGTPEPSTISKSASHGCIRLTNWDALELAHLVSAGTPALLER
jgi:lipoprotein-anchoring transpeptidase ErfK/SrfK